MMGEIEIKEICLSNDFNMTHLRKFAIVNNAIFAKYNRVETKYIKYWQKLDTGFNQVIILKPINEIDFIRGSLEYALLNPIFKRIEDNLFLIGFSKSDMRLLNTIYQELKKGNYIEQYALSYLDKVNF